MIGIMTVVSYGTMAAGVVTLLVLLLIMKKLAREINKVRDDHKRRVATYGDLCYAEFDKMRAMSNLCLHLIPLKIQMDVRGVNTEGRHVCLDMSKWSSQFEHNVTRACGFDIDWVGEGENDVKDQTKEHGYTLTAEQEKIHGDYLRK